ncbi:hypothetical protein [Asaia sp. VD9]|uniref:hypothetical protein n=1 Tax=Asaia sp. VD9 TaxID=3081235 RepID=UPI0030177864
MTDLRRMMEEGVPDPEPPRKLPSILPWAALAGVLVVISLGIRLFWPVTAPAPLPECGATPGTQSACVRSESAPGGAQGTRGAH